MKLPRLPKLSDKVKKWSTLIGCSLLLLSIGLTMATGNLSTYLTSYLRVYVDSSITFGKTAVFGTVSSAVGGVTSIVSGILIDKFRISLLLTLIVGCVIYDAGILLSYFAVKSSYWFYLGAHSVLLSIGMGIISYPPFAISLRYFPNRLGTGSSLITLSSSIGSIISTQLQTAYINPQNLSPGEIVSKSERYFSKSQTSVLDRLPNLFLILGFIAIGIQSIAVLLIFEKKGDRKSFFSICKRKKNKNKEDEGQNEEQKEEKKEDHKEEEKKKISSSDTEEINKIIKERHPNSIGIDHRNPLEGFNLKQAIKNLSYWKILLIHFFITLQFGFLQQFYRQFGETFINDDRFISIVGSLMTAASAVGHIVWGIFVDKFSYKTTLILLSSLSIEFLTTFYFVSLAGAAKSALYLIWLVIIFFASSGIHVALLDSLILLGMAQIYTKIGFEWIFLIEAVAGIIGLVVVWSYNVKNYKNEDL